MRRHTYWSYDSLWPITVFVFEREWAWLEARGKKQEVLMMLSVSREAKLAVRFTLMWIVFISTNLINTTQGNISLCKAGFCSRSRWLQHLNIMCVQGFSLLIIARLRLALLASSLCLKRNHVCLEHIYISLAWNESNSDTGNWRRWKTETKLFGRFSS